MRRKVTVAGLKEFLKIPSVSTKPEHKDDLRKCAAWLAEKLNTAGLKADVIPTGGHPAVVAKNSPRQREVPAKFILRGAPRRCFWAFASRRSILI